jgi:hypothetical protein
VRLALSLMWHSQQKKYIMFYNTVVLGAFISVVKELFGSEQARLAVEDWLDELVLMQTPPGLTGRDWRSITIAASARLANRVRTSGAP